MSTARFECPPYKLFEVSQKLLAPDRMGASWPKSQTEAAAYPDPPVARHPSRPRSERLTEGPCRAQPDFHPQRPVIVGVDTGLESPETATLKYEEAAARASNGGDLRGDSPPGLLPMSYGKPQQAQMHGE
jgi:hypothetical protein